MVISLAALRADHAQTAKLQLARTLRLAHQVVADTQLVGTVLTALAPLQLEKGDVSGTRQLLDSALTILKGIKDLPSMLECTRGLVALQERMNKPGGWGGWGAGQGGTGQGRVGRHGRTVL